METLIALGILAGVGAYAYYELARTNMRLTGNEGKPMPGNPIAYDRYETDKGNLVVILSNPPKTFIEG